MGRPDDCTQPSGVNYLEVCVPLLTQDHWTAPKEPECWKGRFLGGSRPRTKDELIQEMGAELSAQLPGVDWNFSQNIRDNVMEALSGVKGDNSVKIFGPDLPTLEKTAAKVKSALKTLKDNGIEDV